jgi:transposase
MVPDIAVWLRDRLGDLAGITSPRRYWSFFGACNGASRGYRTGLGSAVADDDAWERIKTLLPGREGSVGVTAADNRLFVEAVLYRYRTGMPWRDLPERFGEGTKIHTRFSRWAKSGVWERLFQHLAADADNEYAMIDSTIVRAHQHSAGAQKKLVRTKRSGARAAD